MNPNRNDVNTLKIQPAFVESLDHASAYHVTPAGKISAAWRREENSIALEVEIPKGITATAELEPHFCFEDGEKSKSIVSGKYKVIQIQ